MDVRLGRPAKVIETKGQGSPGGCNGVEDVAGTFSVPEVKEGR